MFLPSKQAIQADYTEQRNAIQETYDRHRDQFPDLAGRQYAVDLLSAMRCRDARLASLKRKRQK